MGQFTAQVVHGIRGIRAPRRVAAPAPEFSMGRDVQAFLPAPGHVRWTSDGKLELINRVVDFRTGVDWDHSAEGSLWAYHLHQCDHLRVARLSPARRGQLVLDWIHRHRRGVGWDPHPTSLRVLNWGKLLLTPDAIELSPEEIEEMRASLAGQIETLDRNLEYRLQANHLLSNLIAMVFGGLLMAGPRADRWLARIPILERELSRQFHADGGHEERSPMYHALLLENLLDLLNLARARRDRAGESLLATLEGILARALAAHGLWCHPDGEIGLFGDSAFGIASAPAELLAYGRRLGVVPASTATPGLLEQTGYARLEADSWTLIASIAPPGPAHQPGHAHCDALAFELSRGHARVVCDTGVYEYLPGAHRQSARTTLSHATLQVAGVEQAEIWAAHRVGGRPRVQLVSLETDRRLEAICASWSTPGTLHRRIFSIFGDVLEIRDLLEGELQPIRLSLPLAPGIEPDLSRGDDGRYSARLSLDDDTALRVTLPASVDWRVERRPYYPEFGCRIERACLVGESTDFRCGDWRFELSD
jgi:uncharacterized heparinase superfamily protein